METRVVDGYSHYNSIISDGRRVRRMRRTQLSAQKLKNNSNSSRKAYILKTQTDFYSRQKSREGQMPKIQPKRQQVGNSSHKKHYSNVHNEYYSQDGRQQILNNYQSSDRSQQYHNNQSINELALSKQALRVSNERNSKNDDISSRYKQNNKQYKRPNVNYRMQRLSQFNNGQNVCQSNGKGKGQGTWDGNGSIRLKQQDANASKYMENGALDNNNSHNINNNNSNSINNSNSNKYQNSNKIQSKNKNHPKSNNHLNQYGFATVDKNSKKTSKLADINGQPNQVNTSGQLNNSGQAINNYGTPNTNQNRKSAQVYVIRSSAREWQQNKPLGRESSGKKSLSKSIRQSIRQSSKKEDSIRQSSCRQYSVKQQSSYKQKSIKQSSLKQKSLRSSHRQKSPKQSSHKQKPINQISPQQSSHKQSSSKQSFQKKQLISQSQNKLSPKHLDPNNLPTYSFSNPNKQPQQSLSQKPSSQKLSHNQSLSLSQSSNKQGDRNMGKQGERSGSHNHSYYQVQQMKQSSIKSKNSKQRSSVKEGQQIFSNVNSNVENGETLENISKIKLDPAINHIVTSSSARKQNWRQPLNSLTQVEQQQLGREPAEQEQHHQSGHIPQSNGRTSKFLFESSKRISLNVQSLNQSQDNQRNLPLLSKGPTNSITTAIRNNLRSNGRFSQIGSGSSLKHDPNTLQGFLDNLDIHQYFVSLIEDFRYRTQQFSPDAEYLDLLCYLLDRKYYLQKVNIQKALEGGRNIFKLTQFQISSDMLQKYRYNSAIAVQAQQIYQESKQLFKKLRDSYYQLKPRLKNNPYFKFETPSDNFTKQIVRLLEIQLRTTQQKLNQNTDSQQQEIYQLRILQIMEMVFLFSELNGRKVKKLQLYDEIQNFTQYCDQNQKLLEETFQYFKGLPKPNDSMPEKKKSY